MKQKVQRILMDFLTEYIPSLSHQNPRPEQHINCNRWTYSDKELSSKVHGLHYGLILILYIW